MTDIELLESLEELRVALADSEVERYNYFISHSADGRDCRYAQAALKLFQTRQQRQILVSKILALAASLQDHS